MWNRKDLKSKAKLAFKANYWKCVVVAVILSALTAVESSSSKGNSGDAATDIANLGISPATLVAIILGIVGVGLIIGLAIELLVKNVIVVGCNEFFVATAKGADPKISTIFVAYKENFKNVVVAMLMQDIFVFLWSLLFIIPGIVKAYEYRMVPYLIANDADMEWKDAFAKSKEMMTGNKWKAFVLDLSFIGWHILGAITCGIVEVFWVLPYVYTTNAELYLALGEE